MEVPKYRKLLPSQSVASGFAGSNPALPTNVNITSMDCALNITVWTNGNVGGHKPRPLVQGGDCVQVLNASSTLASVTKLCYYGKES